MAEKRQTPTKKSPKVDLKNPVPRRDSSSDKLLSDTEQASGSPDDKTLSDSTQALLQVKDKKVVRRSLKEYARGMLCCRVTRPNSSSDTELLETAQASSSTNKLLEISRASSSAGDTAQATADEQEEEVVPTQHPTGSVRDVARSVLDFSPSVKQEENLQLRELRKSSLAQMPESPTAKTPQVSEQPKPSRPCSDCDPNVCSLGSVCVHIARAARRLEFGGQTEPTQIARNPRNPVFGSKLKDDVVDKGQDVPRVVVRCVAIIEEWCQRNKPFSVLVYEPTECPHEKELIKNAFVEGRDADLGNNYCIVWSYGNVLKQYLRELPDPVIPVTMYDLFVDLLISGRAKSLGTEYKTIAELVRAMPSRHRSTLQALLRHFTKLLRWQAESDPEETYMTLISEVSHVLMRPRWSRIGEIANHIKVYNDILIELIRAGCWGEEPPYLPEVMPFKPPMPAPRTDDRSFTALTPAERLRDAPWYWGKLPVLQALGMVRPNPVGSFLVRDSASVPGNYILVLKLTDTTVKLVRILCKNNLCGFAEPLEYPSVVTLITWYGIHSLSSYNKELTTSLQCPLVPRYDPEYPSGSIGHKMQLFFMINQRHRKLRAMYVFLVKWDSFLQSEKALNYQAVCAYVELKEMLDEQIKSHQGMNPTSADAEVDKLSFLRERIKEYGDSLAVDVRRNDMRYHLNNAELALLKNEIKLLIEHGEEELDWLKGHGFTEDQVKKLEDLDESLWFVDCQRPKAEEHLFKTETGTFLIRPKPEENAHVLSVMYDGTVEHYKIYHENKAYGFRRDNLRFKSLKDLVDYNHYRSLAVHKLDLDACLLFPVTIYGYDKAISESERNQEPQAAQPEPQAAQPEPQAAQPEQL